MKKVGVKQILRQTLRIFSMRGGRVMGAATAFYALLAVAPMLLIALAIVGRLTSEEQARARILADLGLWIGAEGARTIGGLLDSLSEARSGAMAGGFGAVLLIYAGFRLFTQLRFSLNSIWGIREVGGGTFKERLRRQVRKRLQTLVTMVLLIAILVATLLAKAALAAAAAIWGFDAAGMLRWHALELATSFAVWTAMLAVTYKVLPAARIAWDDAWKGAVVSSLLFSIGATAVGWYLGARATHSTYGAAGSVVAMLLWTYYCSQVFFLGAAFTRVRAELRGRGVELPEGTVRYVLEVDEALVPSSNLLPSHPAESDEQSDLPPSG